LQKPELCLDPTYPIDKSEFQILFHRIIFATIYNLSLEGCKSVSIVDIDTFVSPYVSEYNVLKDNSFEDYIKTVIELTDVENFEYYYKEFRKFSCLNTYRENGFDIKRFYDEDKSEESQLENLNQYTIEDIINYYEGLEVSIKRQFTNDGDDTVRKKAGDNGIDIFHSFKETPMIGLSFESKYLTTLWDGWRKGQLYIRSGDTSSGKSRSCIGDLANICAKEIYDLQENKWMENPNGINKGLYIGCEMNLDEECDPLFWAYISGVESAKITKGKTSKEEDKLVEHAISVVQDSNIYLTDMPSFNIKKIEEEIAYYKRECDIGYVAFDYMLLSNSLVKEFVEQRGRGVGARGDEILLELSKQLKDMCKKYDIGMITSTQVNADIKDYRNRDYQVLRGGKAVADKATGGSISMPITNQELKLIEPYLERRGFGLLKPNFVETVYKSRFSEYPKECKIFSNYNLGNMRKVEMFVTDKDFKPINIPKTIVQLV
jgi:replicative DNA helicase